MENLTMAIGWVSLVLGAAFLVAGLVMAWRHKDATVPTVKKGLQEQGAVDDAIGKAADFAKALKDLDLGSRLMVVGVWLIAVAAIAAGLNEVADSVDKIADAVKTN
jgi:hypothetical protein